MKGKVDIKWSWDSPHIYTILSLSFTKYYDMLFYSLMKKCVSIYKL